VCFLFWVESTLQIELFNFFFPKWFVFIEWLFPQFCNESSCVSSPDLQAREKIGPFFYRKDPKHLFGPCRHQKLCFYKYIFWLLLQRNFVCFLSWFASSRKNSTIFFFILMVPIIYSIRGDPKSCIYRKAFFPNFCIESSFVSCPDLQVRENKAPFNFYRNEWS